MKIDVIQKAKIIDINASWYGISAETLMHTAGKNLAQALVDLDLKKKSISIVCGLGNNGGDGFIMANELSKISDLEIKVYLVGRPLELKTNQSKIAFQELQKTASINPKVIIKQDAFAKDINDSDILVEALLGTGSSGKLLKRYDDIVKKLNSLSGFKISVDFPITKFAPDIVFSLQFAKTENSKVIDMGIPTEIETLIGPGEVQSLAIPEEDSYKTKTGELFVFGGSENFHGAPMMAIMGASKFIGSVYFYTTPDNRDLVKKIKEEVYEFITVSEEDIEKYAGYADAFLIGPGLEDNMLNRSIIKKLFEMYPEKPKVIDAYAIAMAPKDMLKNCILTPHRGELRHIWGDETNLKTKRLEGNLRRFATESGVIVILKGHVDILFNNDGTVMFNKTGNPGMAKGGTGDILSGIVGGFLTKNDPWLAARAATYVCGLAGDLAYKDFGYNYSATDIVPYIQKAVKLSNDYDPNE